MARGILAAVNGRGRRQASIRPLRPDPLPGDEAVAECRVARGQDAGEGAL